MTEWVWRSHRRSEARTIDAVSVKFENRHVVFFGEHGNMILAIVNEDVHDLHPAEEGDPVWW